MSLKTSWFTKSRRAQNVDDIRLQGKVVNTLQARMGTGGGNMPIVAKDTTVRRLMPVETERLQGFPDRWTEFDAEGNTQADSHRYKQMGNALAIPVADWIVKNLVSTHN